MAKNSCVIITPDLKQRYCQTDNISENDLALMFYEYLESPRTPNELTDKVLNSESFIGWYNWHFKLGNSRFLIQTPSAYQNAMKNWNNMKTYGMDEEGYLVVDTPLKNKVLEWIKQNRDYETHFVIYTNLEGKTTLKVEKPTYVGKKLSRTKAMSLEGIQIQTIEDIQKFLKETHTIHRYMGKWWISKTSDGLKKLQEYIADNVIDANKVHTTNTKNGIIVEFYEGLDLMYQKTPDIKAIVRENNRPLKALGSNKNIEEKLKRSNLTPELRKAIIEAITKNPKLKEHSLGSLLTAISIQRDRELLDIYNESFSKKVDQELDNFLQDFLKEYGFEFVIGDAIKEFGDYSGVFDAVNKVIYLANNRNKITAAEEFSHAFIKLMGKSFKSPEFKFLMDGIEDTELYKQVYNEYSSIYTKTLEDGSEVPNTYKIKEEAIGQALASAIVDKWETKNKPESEKTWWDKLKEWVNSILSKFENTEYLNFESLIDKIASEIISGDKSRLTKKYDSVDTNLLDYVETIENQTKKDGGKALEFLRFFTNIGSIITGSLAYRYQGTVYRPAQDSIHDIDLEIPKSAHGFQLSNIEFNAWKEQKNTSELAKKILEIDFFKKVKEKYPKMKFADFVMLQREVKGTKRYFISGVYSENERLSTKFLSLKGDYASRLDQFSEEERNKIYLFDFFLKEGEQPSVFDPNYSLRLKPWQPIFTVKVDEMGRDKDTFDYKMWTPFEAFKDTITTPTEDLMFQKNYNRPTINKTTLFNSDGSINWEYYESILNDYHNNQPDSMFAKGRYTLATRPENHFEGEKNTLNHIKFVTQSMLDLLEGKFDVDLPFVSEARASLKNQRDLMVLAAMFHDVAKPYRHGDIHGWEAADIVRDVLGVDYNNRIAEWAVRHHMPMPFSHKAEFNLANPEALEVAKNIARDARRLGIDAQTAINAFVLINSADVINGRELYVEDNWAKKEASKGKTRYDGDISVKNVLTIELTEKVELLKKAFEEIQSEDLGDPAYNYSHQKRFDYIAFPEGGRKDGRLPYLSNEVEEYNDEEGESTIENVRPTVIVNDAEHIKYLISAATLSTNKERRAYMEDARLKITSFKKGDTIGAVELLKLFNEDSIPKQYKALANVLIPLFEKQDFHIKFTGNEDRKAAGTTFSSGTRIIKEIYINLDAPKIKKEPYVTIIHELIHTLSLSALNANSQLNSEIENLMGVVKDFLSKHTNEADRLKVYTVGDTTHELPFDLYGLKNSKEFFTVAFTEPSFQRLLMAIPLEKKETAWSRFLNYIVDGLKSLFNIHFSRPTNVFEALVPYIADVITKSAYLGSELTSNENIDASAWEVALNEEQLSVATKIAKEVLSMVDPYTVSDNYFTVMKNFGGYFEGGGAIIENDFPSISAEMISKLEEHIWTGSEFTEEDAIRFLQEAGYAKQQSGYTNASTFVMHSGGATGSDSYWEDAGKPYGLIKVNHYYHGKKTPRGNVPITEEQFERGKKAVYRANQTLKRKPAQYMDLLARNYIQVENADAIFAVGILKNGVVDGGTGWAVQMAIDDGKPVYVFDQIKKSWYTYINGQWSMCDTPTLTPNFAGIGTREENLREEGKQAIRNVYAKTFGGQVVEMPINEFEVGDRIYHQIRTFFGKKVAYSQNFKEDHIYLVKDKSGKWVPADYSVSELTEEKFDPNSPWKPVSTGLGNTNDMFMRDFFAHQLKPSYPNLTQEQYDELLKGANEVVKYLDNFLGAGNYKVSSQEFPILGYTTKGGETKTVAGTMDLLIYDKKGNFYIIDMKTKRVLGDGTPDLSNKIEGYSKQQYMYKNMLETAIPELRGRIQPPLLLVSTVSYPSPKEGYTYTQDKNGVVYASYINTNGAKVTKPITQIAGYVAPRYHSFMSTKDVDNTIKEILTVMTPEEFSLEYGTPEIIKESVAHRNKVVLNTEHSKLSAETEALYTIIPKEEVRFLGKKIASTFSYYVDMLLRDPEAKEMFADPETGDNPFKDYDFTKMSRSELLNVSMLVDILLELIQEDLFNIENEQNVDKEDGIKAKLNAAYVNFDAIIKASYTEFIKLEGLTFNKSITKTYIPDGVDPSIINPTDPTEGEDNGREHWQLGVRNMSAMSGLSAQLRRFLSTIEEVDADNDLVADRYGYGLSTTLDGNEIVNSLLIWLKDCNTMEEMETVLSKLTATHPWIKTLLDEISNEPIRSQFFQCFRKDFTEYSIIVTVKKTDPYTGMPYWETVNRIINSVGAVDKVISEVKDAYFSRDIAIFKDGLWNSSKIESLATTIDSIQKHYKNKANWEALKKNLHNDEMFKTVKGVLESLGVMFDDTILADLIASDADVVNFIGGKLSKVLVQAKYIVESLSKGINKESYDPFEKGSNDSVYNAYKNIATIAEPYVVNALEASTYANGKMYYSFVPPSYMGQLFNNLINTDKDSLELFLENNYAKYEWFKTGDSWNIQWLNDIENNREVLARKVQLSYEETDYVDLGERAYAMSLLKEYFYDQKNKSLAWYRIPTLSNKPSSEFIRNKRYSGDFRKELTKQLYNVFIQEVKRMQTVIDRAISSTITEADIIKNYDIAFSKNPEIEKAQQAVLDKIKNNKKVTREDLFVKDKYIFEDSGASFKFLDGFVEDIKSEDNIVGQYIIDKVFNRNNTNVKDADFIAPVKNRISKIMESKVEAAKTYFNSIGLNDSSMNFMLQGDSITKKTTPEEAMNKLAPAIEEYVWNDFVATINIVQLTTTDLAFYKDSVDFQKRFAQVHSPGLRLNKDATNIIKGNKVKVSDGYLRSLLIKDAVSPSNIKENVRVALENRYNSMEEGPAKEEFKIMKDLIISQYNKINEADAQAYTSPTGYMKKMVMAGEWTPLMQEAYERIKSGNYNVNDLGVVWQPIKPFVYTQNGVDGHSSISKNIKVPSQHKNSEYLLLIADALTRGDKQDNVLNAIMDFMEETHEDKNGNYKQDGIDTIEFDSAVKVGVHGVIDINNLPASEVKAKLKLALSNPAHIFAYPVEDYAIQQSVPDHFNDHSQPMGSQIRALILSDLIGSAYTPLKSKKAYTSDEVRKVYQDLIARNVYRSWDELAKDLNLKGDRSARNIQLSELLQEEMSKDARYGADLRRAVMLDANNEFVIPLDDPIHSSRIQQVINSIVKSRINKQRTKGGPVVQASSFGLSDELNIIFQDKNGRELPTMKDFGKKRKLKGKELEIAYKKYIEDKQATVKHFECYIPLPSSVFEEYMLVDDGKGGKRILSIEEATDPTSEYFVHGLKDCLNAIGYRIPTEDTYSMVPIKIAGFVPKAAGEAVMLPKEITLLSGSDKYRV